jgi:hypothetical protein
VNEEEHEGKGNVDPDNSDTGSESATDDEEETLLRQQAELKARLKARLAELKKQRVAKLRVSVARRAAEVAALEAEVALPDSYLPAEAVTVAPVSVVTVNQTPAHSGLRPRQLAYDQSARSRKAPSAAAVAHQASIDALPDAPAVQVMVAPTVVGSGWVVAPVVTTIAPAAPPAALPTASRDVPPPKVEKFTGDDLLQNGRVENWVDAMDRWLNLSRIPPEKHLDYALAHLPSGGSAYEWVQQRRDEVAYSGKQMTWEWLRVQLIEHYAQPVGPAAMQTEWQMLRMGVKSAEGMDPGKSTRTVSSYTNRFLFYMRRLTMHSVQTTDVLVIDRYVLGIREGYQALYDAMWTAQKTPSPRFATLQEAIKAAEDAEADLAIIKLNSRGTASSASSGNSRFRGHNRFGNEALNNLQGEESSEDGEDTPSPTPSKVAPKAAAKLFGFRFISLPTDGRFKLSEKEQKMLYDQKRCYRCYEKHLLGPRNPACEKPVMKTAPKPLK